MKTFYLWCVYTWNISKMQNYLTFFKSPAPKNSFKPIFIWAFAPRFMVYLHALLFLLLLILLLLLSLHATSWRPWQSISPTGLSHVCCKIVTKRERFMVRSGNRKTRNCHCCCCYILFQELPANVTELWEDESSELRRMLESHIVPHRRLRADSFYNNLRLPSINSLPINFNVLHSVCTSCLRKKLCQC